MPLGEHGTIRKFGYPIYEELAHLVLMMRWPGEIPAGSKYDDLVSNVDLPETLLEAAALDIPKHMQGRSLFAATTGDGLEPAKALFLGAFNFHAGVVTADGYKFISNRGKQTNELYFLPEDPLEKSNIMSEASDLAAELHRKLWDFHEPWRAKRSRHHRY